MEASSPFFIAIVGIIFGFIVGLACYRLFSKGERDRAVLRQTLLEREHQIAELKKAMGSHITNVRQRLDNIRSEANQLEQQLGEDAAQWRLGKVEPQATTTSLAAELTNTDKVPSMPRDYADGKGGTLSEDFGLKDSNKEEEVSPPQPPRY